MRQLPFCNQRWMCTDAAPRGTIVLGWAVWLLTCPHDRLIKVCKIMVAACKSSRAATASLTQKTARPSRLPRNIETSSGAFQHRLRHVLVRWQLIPHLYGHLTPPPQTKRRNSRHLRLKYNLQVVAAHDA